MGMKAITFKESSRSYTNTSTDVRPASRGREDCVLFATTLQRFTRLSLGKRIRARDAGRYRTGAAYRATSVHVSEVIALLSVSSLLRLIFIHHAASLHLKAASLNLCKILRCPQLCVYTI